MTSLSRRTMVGGAVSLIALSAGCLSDETGSEPDDDANGDGDGDDDEQGSPGNDGDPETDDLPDGLADYETRAFQHANRSTTPTVDLLRDRQSVDDWLADQESARDDLADFVDETDFDASILVPIEAGAPDPCHELGLESIDIDEREDGDDALVLEAAVRETAADEDACITQEVTVGRLVRATFESEPLTTVSASIVDRNGEERGIEIPSDSSSESASDGD